MPDMEVVSLYRAGCPRERDVRGRKKRIKTREDENRQRKRLGNGRDSGREARVIRKRIRTEEAEKKTEARRAGV